VENLWSNSRHCGIPADKRTTDQRVLCGWESLRRVEPGCYFGRVAFQAMIRTVNGRLRSLTVAFADEFARMRSNTKTPVAAVRATTGVGVES
jgi:hypothetical protein